MNVGTVCLVLVLGNLAHTLKKAKGIKKIRNECSDWVSRGLKIHQSGASDVFTLRFCLGASEAVSTVRRRTCSPASA